MKLRKGNVDWPRRPRQPLELVATREMDCHDPCIKLYLHIAHRLDNVGARLT